MSHHHTTDEFDLIRVQCPTAFERLVRFDQIAVEWLSKHSLTMLRISIGVVFIWFGALKLIPGMSPAEPLIRAAISFLPMDLFMPMLAVVEIAIGLGFVTARYMRLTIFALLLQMAGAMSPLILSPDRIWTIVPFALTLEGQYVIKDIILISAGLVVGATVRGGRLTSA